MTSTKPIEKAKSRRVSVTKSKLAETAGEMQAIAVEAGRKGIQEAVHGAERLEAAADMAAGGAVLLAQGASDITRAVDEKVISDRMAVLSDAVAAAGVVDIAEGAEMLAASEDVGVISALVGMMSLDSLEHGLELARMSGEMQTVGEIVNALKLPVLATFLSKRADRMHEMSMEQIRLSISTDGVSKVLAVTGKRITSLGENEVEEGIVRLAVSQAASERSDALSKASEELTMQGMEETLIAGEVGQAARAEAIEGVAEISTGSAVVGAALAMEGVASTLKEKSE